MHARRIPLTPVWLPRVREVIAELITDAWDHRVTVDMYAPPGESMRGAQLWWVSSDMGLLAVDTARHGPLPEWLITRDRPASSGLVVFEKPLPVSMEWSAAPQRLWEAGAFGASHAPHLPVRAIGWLPTTDGRQVVVTAYSSDPRILIDSLDDRLPLGQIDFGPPYGEPDEAWLPIEGAAQILERILAAVMLLSQEPALARMRPATWGLDRMGQSMPKKRPAPLPVTIIDLRRLAQPAPEDGPQHTEREYTQRWIVRGHWRDQHVGPKHGQIRRTWVRPYVAGPEDMPLVIKEPVWVWRR